MRQPLTGIILAGGQSRRMGMEKGLVIYKSQPLIHWSVAVFKEICDEILISSNSDCYHYLGYKVVRDAKTDSGPMGGIYSCLLESKTKVNLVLSCDMPFITPDIFNILMNIKGDSRICVPWYENDHYEPLCGIYLKDVLPEMKIFMDRKNYKLPELFHSTQFKAVKISDIKPRIPDHYFMNINSPIDLESAEKLNLD